MFVPAGPATLAFSFRRNKYAGEQIHCDTGRHEAETNIMNPANLSMRVFGTRISAYVFDVPVLYRFDVSKASFS